MNYLTVGVLGHVDHGKTALVRALTGVDTDRLKEERERGISILLGFADLALPGGRVAFVDVPGHERFVRTMISGATGIRAVLLVIDAIEGVRPQTREHFDIARILGVPGGIVAITKCDAAEPDAVARTRHEIGEFAADSFLAHAPVIETSAVSGHGLDELRAALGNCIADAAPQSDEGIAYLPIDRAFSMTGFGTIVTGTLRRGTLNEGDEVQIYPGDTHARVRQIESHGEHVAQSLPGWRTAVNLRGVEKSSLGRGMVLATPGSLTPSAILDITITLLPGAEQVQDGEVLRLLFGTTEAFVRVRLLDRPSLEPSGECVAQLHADAPVPFLVRERFVLRTVTPVTTIGGGMFLGASTRRRPRRPESVAALKTLARNEIPEVLAMRVTEAGPEGLDAKAFAMMHRFTIPEVTRSAEELGLVTCADGRLICREVADELEKQVSSVADLDDEIRSIAAEIEAVFRDSGLEPPPVTDVVGRDPRRNRAYRHLVDSGQLVPTYAQGKSHTPANAVVFHRDAIAQARETLLGKFGERGAFGTPEAKAALGISRKFLIPLLEYLDTQRFTRRRGDVREFVARDTAAGR
jgi:selenocysteine-specific elongation factor